MEKKYSLKNYDFNDINKRIIVPSFQRGIEWNTAKQKAFIKNILDGNPFGCILISEDNRDSSGKYYLIDGLQRITTIRLFKKNKFDFLDEEYLNELKLMNLIEKSNKKLRLNDSYEDNKRKLDKLKKDFYKIIANNKSINEIYNNDKNDYILIKSDETDRCLNDVKKEFFRYIDISNLKIPTIIYKGNDLANVFVNLNTTAVQLTKYEIYAASWGNKKYNITDKELKNKVIEKYKELESHDYEVEKTEEEVENGITFFEYCYALGKLISEKYQYLFKNKTTNSCGFEILTLLCGLELSNENEIIEYFKDAPGKFLVDLKKEICNSILVVENILKEWIIAKNLKINISDKTYMIYHIIMCYINFFYKIVINPTDKEYMIKARAGTSEEIDRFKRYLPYHYLLDSISGFWDLNRQVSDLRRLIDNDSKRYFSKPNYNDVEKAFRDYYNNNQDLYSKKVTFENKLILDYLLKLKLEKMDSSKRREIDELFNKNRLAEKGKMIDFEHIISKKKFEHIFDKNIGEICSKYKVYSLGNLCYLDSKSNRAKGGLTIYEFKDQYDVFLGNVEQSNYLAAINYPKEEELEFVNEKKEDFIKGYNEFIANREKQLINELKNLLNEKLKNN